MPKAVMTAAEIEDLIVREVRRHAHCDGFKSIGIYSYDDGVLAGANWGPSVANYGESGKESCDAALREIIPRFQRQYSLRT